MDSEGQLWSYTQIFHRIGEGEIYTPNPQVDQGSTAYFSILHW